jgi:hypothetical protein
MSLNPLPVIERSALSAYIPANQFAAYCTDYVVTQPGAHYTCLAHDVQLAVNLRNLAQDVTIFIRILGSFGAVIYATIGTLKISITQ